MSSRVSRKSGLSPSATRGASGIDLGKDSGVDMGRKARPSATSGGIGVTQEVANIGGVSVTGGVSVDVSPLAVNVSGETNAEDPNKNSISISGSAEVPGGFLGVGGGVKINTNTGEVIGGSIGGEIGGLGINVSSSEGDVGVEFTLQIPFTPVEISLGFGFPKKEEPTTPISPTPSIPGIAFSHDQIVPLLEDNKCYHLVILWHTASLAIYTWDIVHKNALKFISQSSPSSPYGGGNWTQQTPLFYASYQEIPYSRTPAFIDYHEPPDPNGSRDPFSANYNKFSANFKAWGVLDGGPQIILSSQSFQYFDRLLAPFMLTGTGAYLKNHIANTRPANQIWDISAYEIPCSRNNTDPTLPKRIVPLSPSPIPFPNPPPRRQNVDECCRDSVRMLRRIHKHLGVSPIPGMEPLEEFAGVKTKGEAFQGDKMAFPFEVPKRWIDPVFAKRNERITVRNLSELLLVIGAQNERLERVLGTGEFLKDSQEQLRQSETGTLRWLTQRVTGLAGDDFTYPDPNDFWFNTDDGIINEKKVEVKSFADGFRYLIESQNRLERILPVAEIKNSTIPARWVYPGKKGQLRVGNLIHLVEYMFRADDRARGFWPQKITIKAANPAIKDDKPIVTEVHSQADMLRIILQQLLDVEGDGDMGSNYDLRRTYLDIMAFQMLAKNTKYVQAITEYLGFDITEEVSKIPIPFDPFAGQDRSVIEQWWIKYGFGEAKTNFPTKNTESEIEQLSAGLLQNSELEVSTIKFGSIDAKKDPKTLKEALIEILKHSSASAAAVTEVATESALDRVVDAAGIAQKLASFLMRRDIRESLGIGDLDNWISSAEKGYTDNLESESLRFPESNTLEPYGRPATQNPTMREIDTKDPKAD
ncbi:hypothetical protein D0A34_23620 [Microcoleus vaginatus PCC 9802]|uniref:hypothetical protein n=2 Tax=Microcoleus vaginatus TaxID=119532 RepID=UPI0002E50FE6|nr:hypothetical protein D0A34_23620 [Microcoleus vaginatus PCC 9802]